MAKGTFAWFSVSSDSRFIAHSVCEGRWLTQEPSELIVGAGESS